MNNTMPSYDDKHPGKKAEIAQLKIDILELHIAGNRQRAIAQMLKISVGTVNKYLKGSLRASAKREEYLADYDRTLMNIQLKDLLASIWLSAIGAPPVKGNPAIPPDLKAYDRVLKTLDQYADLNGLKAAKSIDLTSGGEPLKGYVGWSPDVWDQGDQGEPQEGEITLDFDALSRAPDESDGEYKRRLLGALAVLANALEDEPQGDQEALNEQSADNSETG